MKPGGAARLGERDQQVVQPLKPEYFSYSNVIVYIYNICYSNARFLCQILEFRDLKSETSIRFT